MKTPMTLCSILCLLPLIALAPEALASPPPEARFALIVGVNQPSRPSRGGLRYADDDAVLYYHLLAPTLERAYVLTTLDEDSQGTQSLPAEVLHPPTRRQLEGDLEDLFGAIRRRRAEGARTVLYFIYNGHGEVEGQEGAITLADGLIRRSDFRRILLEATPAHVTHVIVDACHSYFLVNERGEVGERRPFDGPFLWNSPSREARYPGVGFVLSTSSAVRSYEWEAFQSGVFSHEVRSALAGAADVDGDGRVTYEDLGAFLTVANRDIPNPKYRPRVWLRPPLSHPEEAIIDNTGQPGLIIEGEGWFILESSVGVRLADVHLPGGQKARMAYPERHPFLFVTRVDGEPREYRVDRPVGERVMLADMRAQAPRIAQRGAAHEAFERIFSRPFGVRDVEDYRAERHLQEEMMAQWQAERANRWVTSPLGWSLGGGGLLLMGIGVGALVDAGAVYRSTSGLDQRAQGEANDTINGLNAAGATLSITGAAALIGGIITFILEARGEDPDLPLGPGSDGLRLRF